MWEHDQALNVAAKMTEQSRKYNRERINKKAKAKTVEVGDCVVYKAQERLTFTSSFDPKWTVTRVRGLVIWIRHDVTGKRKTVNIDKVIVVDREISWDEVRDRPKRQTRPQRIRQAEIQQWEQLILDLR